MVQHSEVSELLGMAAAFDQRTVGSADVEAWAAVLDGIRFVDAREALLEHYKTKRTRLTVADLVEGVRAIRSARIGDRHPPGFPHQLSGDVEAQLRWHRAVLKAMGDGMEPEDAERWVRRQFGIPEDRAALVSRPVEALTRQIGQPVPRRE